MSCRYTDRKAHKHRMAMTRLDRRARARARGIALIEGDRVRPKKRPAKDLYDLFSRGDTRGITLIDKVLTLAGMGGK
jgi:hypothetical protein